MGTGSKIAILLLSLVALAHLLRIVFGLGLTVENTEVPMWVSVLGTVIPAAVAYALWREGHQQ